jgi:N-acetylmuramoyl-L-alanine amidase CwlA
MAIPFKQAARGNYLPGRAGKVEYIVIHYTGIPNDTAENNAVYSAREYTGVSAHYFVDENEVCQSVQDTDVAWHCGSKNPRHPYCRNANSIGIEMCNSVGGVPEAVRARTAAFVRQKMKEYGIDSSHVLRHYDVTGKRCPAPWVDDPQAWMDFKALLEVEEVTQEQFDAMLEDYLARRNAKPASQWAVPYIQEAIDAGVMSDVGGTIAAPLGFVTRQELAVVAVNAVKK